LDAGTTQRFSTLLGCYLQVFLARMNRPGYFFGCRLAQRTAVSSVSLEQNNPHLSRLQMNRVPYQAVLGIGQKGLGYFRRKIEFLFHHMQEFLLSRFSLKPLDFVFIHRVHLTFRAVTSHFT
jgi:hypothetical protein